MSENTITQELKDVAIRMKALREIMDISLAEMAELAEVSLEDYKLYEAGEKDFSFTFVYKCARILNINPTDLLAGVSPTLSTYNLTRQGDGIPIKRRAGFKYLNLAPMFKNKAVDPYIVEMPYNEEEQTSPIKLGNHAGQEFDIVVKGSMKIQIGNHIETMSEGDTIYYNATTDHGMIATSKDGCTIYSICIQNDALDEAIPFDNNFKEILQVRKDKKRVRKPSVADKFIDTSYDEDDNLIEVNFKNENLFNFGFDVVDALAEKSSKKLAMIHLSAKKEQRTFTFDDIKKYSNMTANYFESIGIKKGDKVMLILKRHYQFWFAIIALHKIGAIAIPASFQLQEKDLKYRFESAEVNTIICTADGNVAEECDKAASSCKKVKNRIIVNGNRCEWQNFDEEISKFPSDYNRTESSPCGDELMLFYFTSGTTGFPKIAAHSYKYPLGHYITARNWQNVNPDGLHLTISDTGWAKAAWGKIYGQWLNESAIFVYDFDKFDADDILPLFKEFNITTFCAPPTMYRFFIRENLSKYDLSMVEHCTIAGEALNPEVYELWKKHTSLKLMEGFGQSETTVVVYNPLGTTPKPGSMGKPNPLYDVDIILPDKSSAPIGETGEIVIGSGLRHPCGLFQGYYKDGKISKDSWDDEHYYHTGDTAWRDEDGYYWYVGRTDDLIKSSGYRIGPFEIESVLMELPYVLECAVTGVPDEIRGQIVKASIVLTNNKVPSEELKKEIQEYVKHRTAPYKYPRIVDFLMELPKTTSGKIKRIDIRNKDFTDKK